MDRIETIMMYDSYLDLAFLRQLDEYPHGKDSPESYYKLAKEDPGELAGFCLMKIEQVTSKPDYDPNAWYHYAVHDLYARIYNLVMELIGL